MRRFRFVLGLLVTALSVAAGPASNTPSVETKVRKLEIRRVRAPRFSGPSAELCRSLRRADKGFCMVQRMGRLLEFAFNKHQLRILGPQWMSGGDFYLLYFAYDVEGRCPTIVRSLAREILTEKLSMTVRRELREAPVLVMGARAGALDTAVSQGESCSMEGPGRDYYAAPAEAAGLPWSSYAIMETQSQPGYPRVLPEGPSYYPAPVFRGCTMTELAHLLERHLGIAVLDETGASGRYDFTLHTLRLEAVKPKQAARELSEQFGIDARVENRLLEHIVLDAPQPPKRIHYEAVGSVPPAPCPAP